MGNNAHSAFTQIQRKYGVKGVDYIAYKSNVRAVRKQTNDQVQRVIDRANLHKRQDLQWIDQQKRSLQSSFQNAERQAQTVKKGLIKQSEAKHKKTVHQFSGYNAELKRLEKLQRHVATQYDNEIKKVQGRVDQEIRKQFSPPALPRLLQYENENSDSKRQQIEGQCIKKYPQKAIKFNSVELQRSLNWDHFKGSFQRILNKQQVGKENQQGRQRIHQNMVPAKGPICC